VTAAKAKRAETALSLRVSGMSLERIAERLGVDVSTVSRDLAAALKSLAEETKDKTEEFRALTLAQCDEIFAALWPKRSTPAGAEKLVKVLERRAKLLGLDAPKRNEHTGKDGGPLIGLGDLLAMGFDSNGHGGSGTNTPPAVGS